MGIEKTGAIVLNSRDWKETSKIVTFYTSFHGKVTAVAKGARRKTSSFGGCLEIFTHLSLVYYDRRDRDIQIVSQCSEEESFQDIREDLVKTCYAAYFVQLVDEMVGRDEPGEELFRLLLAVLYRLRDNGDFDTVARFLELHLLRVLGYDPLLRSCVVCQKSVASSRGGIEFSASSGGVICRGCAAGVSDSMDISGGVYSALVHLQKVDIGKLSRLKLSRAISEELKTAVHYYLEYLLGKRLKSQEFLEEVIKGS
jgi:DNA repair protein RecO (recombination protein O)